MFVFIPYPHTYILNLKPSVIKGTHSHQFVFLSVFFIFFGNVSLLLFFFFKMRVNQLFSSVTRDL